MQNNNNNKIKVLIVDDEEVASTATKLILDFHGYEVQTASTGNEAIKMSHSNKYDIILMDIGLPDIDGIEVTKQIKQKGSLCSDTPIIVCSGNSMIMHWQLCKQAGMNDYLEKPFSPDMLVKTMNKFCSSKKATTN